MYPQNEVIYNPERTDDYESRPYIFMDGSPLLNSKCTLVARTENLRKAWLSPGCTV